MPAHTALFLDFDGVICDSVVECFVSSWYAYHHLYFKKPIDCMVLGEKHLYRKLRPMVRNSEDNMVIQHIINNDAAVPDQKDFDRIVEQLGPDILTGFRACFYDAREFLLGEHRDFWLGLNRIYPPLVQPLKDTAGNPAVYILSTKKPSFIREILIYNGINWDIERILEARGKSKLEIIRNEMESAGWTGALLVDDQIDHILNNSDKTITGYLAEWGYVSEFGKKNYSVPHMTLEECVELTNRYKI